MYRFVVNLFQPFTLAYLLLAVAVVAGWPKRKLMPRRFRFLLAALVALTVVCSPYIGYLALGSLEWGYPPATQKPAHAKAIVVLAAGVRPQDNVRLESELDAASTFRCVHAANIYHGCGGCLVLVSGGHVDANTSGPPCADLMKGFLLKLGVKATDIALENQSRTTFENGVESKKILAARGLEAIVLITDAMHMPRAERCFRKQGLAVTTAACNYRATEIEYSVWDFVPSPHGADSVQQAFHEWLGLLWYWCNDRI